MTEQNFLAGTNRDGFAAGAAVFAELNAIHFARKGNGRTNRLLLSARAANAGHALAFDVITRERMIAVSVAADEDDPSGLRRMHPHHPRWATLRVLIGRAGIDFVLRVRHGDDTPRDGHALPPGCGSSQVVRLGLFARWWHPEPKRVARRQSHTEVCCERESTPAGRTIRDSEDRMVKRAVGDSSTRSGHA